jgi:His/Glu/Gln/Arg/opine family amino acid ABC transporter permease subunit
VPEQFAQFLPAFLSGLAVNFEIAICSVFGGLMLGSPLAIARLAGGPIARVAGGLVAFCRAAPTFVVMFFLVNVVPASVSLAGLKISMTPWLAVVLSLTVYGTAYVSDNAMEPIRQLRKGSPVVALLFLMSLVRAFFVMVLSSGFGAAVGVVEATTVTLRAIERMPQVSDRLMLIAMVMLMFTVSFQAIYRLIDFLRRRLSQRLGPV